MKKTLFLLACIIMLCACGGSKQPQEESKTLPVSSISLKGKHAGMFKVSGDSYKVNLVQTDDGWQVRAKFVLANKKSYEQLGDKAKYEREISNVYGQLVSESDVELSSLDMSSDDWDMLVAEEIDAEQEFSVKTYSYHHYSYEKAKEIFDKVAGIQLSGIELEEADEETISSSIFDNDTREAMEDVQDLLEAEGKMLNALQQML